jgi:hypothetical protein
MAMPILWSQVEPVTGKKQAWIYVIPVISLGLYLYLALRYPLGPSLADPRTSWAIQVGPTIINAVLHVTIYFGLTLLYLAALCFFIPAHGNENSSSHHQNLVIIVVWLACSGVLMFVSPSGESHDIFDYLFRGRMMVEYQANPLVDVPDSFDISTPYSRYLAWRYHVDTYGPVWEGLSAAVASSVHQVTSWLGWWNESAPVCPKSPESCRLLIAYITGYRLLAIILTGLSGWLIASIVGRTHSAFVPAALAAWLWCPLTLITTAVGGHNDAVMLALVLLGCWLLQQERPYWALIAIILAAHVKLTALIWLPVYALWFFWHYGWRRTLRIFLSGSASGVVLSWLMYLPFGGWQTIPRMLQERLKFLANSLWQILNYLLTTSWGWSSKNAHDLTTQLPTWLFGLSALLISVWFFYFWSKHWRGDGFHPPEKKQILWRAMLAVSILYLLVGSYWLQPWYFLWVLAPTVLLPKSQLTRFILPWLVFGALSSNVIMDFIANTPNITLPPLTKYILPVAIIWGPALLVTCSIFLYRWLRMRSFSTQVQEPQEFL